MKILLIDDEPFVLRLLARQLGNLGFSDLILCESPYEAVDALKEHGGSIELVFCDLQMPEMDGVEFIRHMVSVGYRGGLILVSGEEERILHTAEKLAQAHRLDVLGALHKPVKSGQLKQIMERRKHHDAPRLSLAGKSYGPDELREAIAQGQMVNFYQPQVWLATGKLAGVETLVRWQHPKDGMVFPDQFVSVAEEHGLIDDLTQTVLSAALRQARVWHDANLPLHVAVNVSMDNLTSLEFPDMVVREVKAAGIPLTSLVLEVTESRLMKNPLDVIDILTRLRLKHIGLSIDDFGTGHSSLSQLRDIPFDELKVDRGFVHGANVDASLQAILEASLGMAHQLGMKTVAEGVEDRSDWEFLRKTSCDLGQGYFIAKPMPAEDLLAWMHGWESRCSNLNGANSVA